MLRPGHREQRSLFGEILDWMLAPLLLLWPMSLGLTWLVAQAIANRPYDRELEELARALASQSSMQMADGLGTVESTRVLLQHTAETLTRSDDEDRIYYQVLGRRGELLAGDAALTVPEAGPQSGAAVRFRDDVLGEEPVRVAYLWLAGNQDDEDSGALVQVAETLGKRSQLATEIIKGVILPQFVILPLAVLLVWFALARGIRPLSELQQRIRKRESTDLSPLAEIDVPDEVAPLVAAINDLLQRLDSGIARQRDRRPPDAKRWAAGQYPKSILLTNSVVTASSSSRRKLSRLWENRFAIARRSPLRPHSLSRPATAWVNQPSGSSNRRML